MTLPAAQTATTPPAVPLGREPTRRVSKRTVAARGVVTVAAAGCGGLLLISHLWPQHWTSATRPYLVASFVVWFVRLAQFHLGIICLLIGATAAGARWWRTAVLPLVVGGVATAPWIGAAVPSNDTPPNAGPTLRVLSHNLAWNNRDGDAVARSLRDAEADVVLLQEVTRTHWAAIERELDAAYPYRDVRMLDAGVAILSRLPTRFDPAPDEPDLGEHVGLRPGLRRVEWAGAEVAMLPNGKWDRGVVAVPGGGEIAVYSVHLLKPDSLASFYASRLELEALRRAVAADPLPAVVAGDFNFGPSTPNAAALRGDGLVDAHAQAGGGLGDTRRLAGPWLDWLPGFAVDHIFLGAPLRCRRLQLTPGAGSDHRGILAEIAVTPPRR